MKRLIALVLTSFFTVCACAENISVDPLVGFYKGKLECAKYGYPLKGDNTVYAEVFRGPQGYRVKFQPAIFARAETYGMADNLKATGGKILLSKVGGGEKFKDFQGSITPEEIDVKLAYMGSEARMKLERINVESPTMGLKAPEGALVLFDGKDLSNFWGVCGGKKIKPNWTVNPDASMTIAQEKNSKGKKLRYVDLESKQTFGKLVMHLEFKFPCQYEKLRQARSNSGVIFGGLYELQILDSFGAEGAWDECGSVYRQVPPMVNACIEPGKWQTYDIEFTPAVYDGKKLVSLPKVSAWINGIQVQKDTPFKYPTHMQPVQGAKFDQSKHAEKVFIKLQDHTDPISFRNIWVKPLK